MKKNNVLVACLIMAMAFGTAWAVRGKFGHEQGAAWAGGIGAMALLLVAKRKDWYNNIFKISLAAAFGWGIGGMISYGAVVGYARADDFVNVYYGLLMLFVIGGLYGFLGGGLFGLTLIDTKETKVNWSTLIAEMVAFGLLTYGFLINQLELLMTPPRSELWAACFGACIPLGWYILRKNHRGVLRVALWSALGAGFGFAFGNALHVLGRSFHSPFNFWNVMEYSIGFFGGLGMSYATLTSTWPVLERQPKKWNVIMASLLVVFIPLVLWSQSFVASKFKFILDLGGNEQTILAFQWIGIVTIVISAFVILRNYLKIEFNYVDSRNVFLIYIGSYILLSFLLTGIYAHPIEQYLYLANVAVVLIVAPGLKETNLIKEERPITMFAVMALLIIVIALLAWLAFQFNSKPMPDVGRFQL